MSKTNYNDEDENENDGENDGGDVQNDVTTDNGGFISQIFTDLFSSLGYVGDDQNMDDVDDINDIDAGVTDEINQIYSSITQTYIGVFDDASSFFTSYIDSSIAAGYGTVDVQNDAAKTSTSGVSASYAPVLRDNQEEVSRLYSALFDRNPDESGLTYWSNVMAPANIGGGGEAIGGVAQAFSSSTEFQNIYGPTVSNAEFINLMYKNILNRDADAGGYEYWLNAINQTGERGEMVINFTNSAEYIAKTTTSIDSYLSTISLNGYLLG